MHNFHLWCWYWIDLFTRSCPDSVCTWIKRTSGGETAATTHILAMGACCMHANMQHTAWNRLVELDNLQNSTHIPQYTRKQTTLNFKDNKESKALILLMLVGCECWPIRSGVGGSWMLVNRESWQTCKIHRMHTRTNTWHPCIWLHQTLHLAQKIWISLWKGNSNMWLSRCPVHPASHWTKLIYIYYIQLQTKQMSYKYPIYLYTLMVNTMQIHT